ncbi:MAG: hypothetical protein QOG62_349 [Thermoleophilaceae bacterium]|jgi:hypothetical protein|nr:hypothetical protein [Thermoleophilaceae bacterium]
MTSRIRAILNPSMAVALVALFAAVGGGSAMALSGNNTVSSGDIKPDAVKSSDINNGGVRFEDLGSDAISPRASGSFNPLGVLAATFPPSGIAQGNLIKPNATTGQYCVVGLPFTPRTAVAQDGASPFDDIVSVVPGTVGACPPETQITIRITDNAGGAANSGFNLLVF